MHITTCSVTHSLTKSNLSTKIRVFFLTWGGGGLQQPDSHPFGCTPGVRYGSIQFEACSVRSFRPNRTKKESPCITKEVNASFLVVRFAP